MFPVPPPVLLLLLVLGTELAPPAPCCDRLLDIIQDRLETPQNPLRCCSKHPDGAAYSATLADRLASRLAYVLASWEKAAV